MDKTYETEPFCRECGAPPYIKGASSGLCDECECEMLEREMDSREMDFAEWDGE